MLVRLAVSRRGQGGYESIYIIVALGRESINISCRLCVDMVIKEVVDAWR